MKFISLVSNLYTLPAVIDGPGKYLARSGEEITIDSVDTYPGEPGSYPVAGKPRISTWSCHGKYPNGIQDRWHPSGRLFTGIESDNDIVSKKEGA